MPKKIRPCQMCGFVPPHEFSSMEWAAHRLETFDKHFPWKASRFKDVEVALLVSVLREPLRSVHFHDERQPDGRCWDEREDEAVREVAESLAAKGVRLVG